MHIDANEFDAPVHDTELCIVGAGPAGLSLALHLRDAGIDVTILESGGVEPEDDAQTLGDADVFGIGGEYLDRSRVRAVGGTSKHWGGFCMPLGPEVFEERPWIENSGWPIDADDLAPYYARACDQIGLLRWRPDGTTERDPEPAPLQMRIEPRRFETREYQLKRHDFGEAHGPTLRDHARVTIMTHATCVGLAGSADRVAAARVRTANDRAFEVRAKRFVLATGGIENARLLLLAVRDGLSVEGRDHVGRYYMDHPELTIGEVLASPGWALDLYLGRRLAEDHRGFGALFPTRDAQRRLRLRSIGVQTSRAGARFGSPDDAEIDAAVAGAVHWLDCSRGVSHDRECTPATERIRLFARCEQSPEAVNRVELGPRVDRYGVPVPVLHWRLSEPDFASIRTSSLELGKVLHREGIGRFRPFLDDEGVAGLETTYGPLLTRDESEAIRTRRHPKMLVWGHHMGTTRMSTTAHEGVVDGQGRVHGVANLYTLGCSVFPTGGAANPTLSIVALAVRLADHLRDVAE